MEKQIDNILKDFFTDVYSKIGYPNSGWDNLSQIQYPYFIDKTKVWLIGNEPFGWGSPSCGNNLKECNIELLKELTREFISNDSKKYTRGSSFFNLFYRMIKNDSSLLENIGYWNYYPFGKANDRGCPPAKADRLLFKECNWKNVFWEVIKTTKPELVIMTGNYVRNWALHANLVNREINKIGKEHIINGIKVVNIDHPSYQGKNKEVEVAVVKKVNDILN